MFPANETGGPGKGPGSALRGALYRTWYPRGMGGAPDGAGLRLGGQDQSPGKARPPASGNDGLPQKNKLDISTVSMEQVAEWIY